MRLVRLSDLTEDERKKALEEQQERINKNRQEAQNIQNEANQKFNDYVKNETLAEKIDITDKEIEVYDLNGHECGILVEKI